MRLPMAFKVSIAPRAARLLIVYLMSVSLRSLLSAPATHPAMKQTSSSPATGSDTHSDKKKRIMQENGPATTSVPSIAEETTTETISAAAASDEMTGEATPAASDGAGYVSDSLPSDSDDDSSISHSAQWPPEDDEESLSDQDQQSYLCSRCRQIDFDEIFSRQSLAPGGDPILSFSDEQKILRDPECAFCQAMQFIYPSFDMRNQSWKQLRPLVAARFDTFDGPPSRRVDTKGKVTLTFAEQWKDGTFGRIYRWTRDMVKKSQTSPDDDKVGYLAEEQTIDSDHTALPAASVKPHVDLDLIKRKLDECRGSHSRCRKNRRRDDKGVPGMRLIDCKTRTVVPAPKRGYTYAALSYVWGTSKSTSTSSHVSHDCGEGLPADIPNTITDAMLVALLLKIRYLWCDRYCIRQDPRNKEEEDEKHEQIVRMCDIYGGATITIIAAAGDGPDYGLPGVGCKRQQPPRVRIGSRTLLATLPDPKMLMDRSKWSTRGWTFQEGLLARRRLVFTDQQVYFQCEETGTFEAHDKSGEMSILIDPGQYPNPPVYPYFSMRRFCAWNMIDNYTKLTLGNTQDILNGFLGILKHYEEVGGEYDDYHARHVAGIPLETWQHSAMSWPSALFNSLAWQCNIPGRRRDGFPSWSWTGWYCKNLFGHHPDARLPENRTRSVFVSVEGPNDELVDHSKLHELIEARHDLSEARQLHITAPSLEARVLPVDQVSKDVHNSFPYVEPFTDNRKFAVRYLDFKGVYLMNHSDEQLENTNLPFEGIHCFGIVIDEDHEDIPNYGLGSFGPGYVGARECAMTLIVVAKDGGFERIGVSHIDRKELRQIGSTVRGFRLM